MIQKTVNQIIGCSGLNQGGQKAQLQKAQIRNYVKQLL
jgi:hypothetical protein